MQDKTIYSQESTQINNLKGMQFGETKEEESCTCTILWKTVSIFAAFLEKLNFTQNSLKKIGKSKLDMRQFFWSY